MNERNISGGNHHNSSYQSLLTDIMLGRMETYDASKLNCWAFRKSIDVRDGITLSLGNLCGGYPFPFCGHTFPTSEAAQEKHAPFLKPEYLEKLEKKRAGICTVGCFVGQNNMGKILKMCQIALLNKVDPPIDYDLLREKRIYLFGELLTFDKEEAL